MAIVQVWMVSIGANVEVVHGGVSFVALAGHDFRTQRTLREAFRLG